ncbi:MAG: 50S ribosomal protein L11 methyltransferase [Bacteroidota bacterium]
MDYTELDITAPAGLTEILIAELGQIGFESFTEQENEAEGIGRFLAYIPTNSFNEAALNDLAQTYADLGEIRLKRTDIPAQNWNEEWEKQFRPVSIADQVYIRADFHEANNNLPYELVINPKMSFGTGHHDTTALMIAELLKIQPAGKSVLDAGSGTGVLIIMAAKLGASPLMAFDIDEWPVENARENIALNGIENVCLWQGTANKIKAETEAWAGPKAFDIILANINRNILLDEMPYYSEAAAPGSLLLLSGFFHEDADALEAKGKELGYTPVRRSSGNAADTMPDHKWCCILMQYQGQYAA